MGEFKGFVNLSFLIEIKFNIGKYEANLQEQTSHIVHLLISFVVCQGSRLVNHLCPFEKSYLHNS